MRTRLSHPLPYAQGGGVVNPETYLLWCFSDYVRPKISVKMSSPGQLRTEEAWLR